MVSGGSQTAVKAADSDARDGLDLEFWRWKIVEEGPGPAPKAATQAAQEEGADE